MKKKIVYGLAGIIGLNIVATVVGVSIFFSKFVPNVPEPDFPAAISVEEARKQDLDYLRQFTTIDNSYTRDEKSAFSAALDQLEMDAENVSDGEFAMRIARAVALSDNGHTNVRPADLANEANSLPVRFFWFADGLHIVRAHRAHQDLIGAKVLEYDSQTPDELVDSLAPFHGGNTAYLRFRSPYFFSAPALMHAVGLSENSDSITLKVEDSFGELSFIELPVEANQTETLSLREYPLALHADEETESGNDWVHLNESAIAKTHYGRHPNKQFWTDTLPGGGAYIRIRLIFNHGEEKIGQWLKSLQQVYAHAPANYLVLDLRSNPGGDYMLTRNFAQSIKGLVAPGGKIYTLTDGGTFSAAVVTSAFVSHAASDQGRIVGSQMGDDEQFRAEGGKSMTLPNSKVRASIATGYHDWEHGCKNWSTCYWVNIVLGVAAGPLETDIYAPLSFKDYSVGIDTGLQAIYRAEGVTP